MIIWSLCQVLMILLLDILIGVLTENLSIEGEFLARDYHDNLLLIGCIRLSKSSNLIELNNLG